MGAAAFVPLENKKVEKNSDTHTPGMWGISYVWSIARAGQNLHVAWLQPGVHH